MIINLTQHEPTTEQVEAGVGPRHQEVAELLTLPADYRRRDLVERAKALANLALTLDLVERAKALANLALTLVGPREERDEAEAAEREAYAAFCAAEVERKATRVMIGGLPPLMAHLERALLQVGLTPCYARSERESVEETLADGSVRKVAVFRHLGFYEVTAY